MTHLIQLSLIPPKSSPHTKVSKMSCIFTCFKAKNAANAKAQGRKAKMSSVDRFAKNRIIGNSSSGLQLPVTPSSSHASYHARSYSDIVNVSTGTSAKTLSQPSIASLNTADSYRLSQWSDNMHGSFNSSKPVIATLVGHDAVGGQPSSIPPSMNTSFGDLGSQVPSPLPSIRNMAGYPAGGVATQQPSRAPSQNTSYGSLIRAGAFQTPPVQQSQSKPSSKSTSFGSFVRASRTPASQIPALPPSSTASAASIVAAPAAQSPRGPTPPPKVPLTPAPGASPFQAARPSPPRSKNASTASTLSASVRFPYVPTQPPSKIASTASVISAVRVDARAVPSQAAPYQRSDSELTKIHTLPSSANTSVSSRIGMTGPPPQPKTQMPISQHTSATSSLCGQANSDIWEIPESMRSFVDRTSGRFETLPPSKNSSYASFKTAKTAQIGPVAPIAPVAPVAPVAPIAPAARVTPVARNQSRSTSKTSSLGSLPGPSVDKNFWVTDFSSQNNSDKSLPSQPIRETSDFRWDQQSKWKQGSFVPGRSPPETVRNKTTTQESPFMPKTKGKKAVRPNKSK